MPVTEDYLFSQGHMWCRLMEDGDYLIGVSDHAQKSLGEIVYVELPDPESEIAQGEPLGVIESVKVVNDLIAPISGTVIEANDSLVDQPAVVNDSAYDAGWMLRIRLKSPEQLNNLLNHAQYLALVG